MCLAAPVRERVDRGPWPIACCLEPKSEFSHPARPDLTAWVVALWCCSDGLVITLVLLPAVRAEVRLRPDDVGWIQIILGSSSWPAGFGVITRQLWGRVVGITIATLTMLANLEFIPYYPI